MIYDKYQRNHVILPGREEALESFLKQSYQGMQHKLRNAVSSNSEDALTWSCFDVLANLPSLDKAAALDEILEDSFHGNSPLSFKERGLESKDIEIYVGKSYTGVSTKESTEVDASIEAPGILVFVEAKLYSSVSPASPPEKPHDQIARKLRVGLDSPTNEEREFYFVFLDIAPAEVMFERKKRQKLLGRQAEATKINGVALGSSTTTNKGAIAACAHLQKRLMGSIPQQSRWQQAAWAGLRGQICSNAHCEQCSALARDAFT